MNLPVILLLAALATPIAAGAAWLIHSLEPSWNARQRVFNSAAIAPAIIAMGAACFTLVVLALGDEGRLGGANNFLLQVFVALLATFSSGMLAAYFVERTLGK